MNKDFQLKNFREIHALTQSDVADIIDISRATYSEIENGKRELSLDELAKLLSQYENDKLLIDLFTSKIEKIFKVRKLGARLKKAIEDSLSTRNYRINKAIDYSSLREIIIYLANNTGGNPLFESSSLETILRIIQEDPKQTNFSYKEFLLILEKQGEIRLLKSKSRYMRIISNRQANMDLIPSKIITELDFIISIFKANLNSDITSNKMIHIVEVLLMERRHQNFS